jgi:hypothetical protein
MYRLVKRDNDETSLTLDPSVKHLYWGSTGTPNPINTADDKGVAFYFSSSATSGTTYGQYVRLDSTGAGVEAIAGRFKTLLTTGAAQQAHGIHGTLEYGSTGNTVDVGCGIKGNFVVNGRVITGGEVYGMISEIYYNTSGSTASVRHALICLSAAGDTTGMATCKNAIAFVGTDSTGNMIFTNADSDTAVGSIRILVNGVAKYLRFYAAEA